MRGVEESIKELKDQIAKLDNLILMGEYYVHMVNAHLVSYLQISRTTIFQL